MSVSKVTRLIPFFSLVIFLNLGLNMTAQSPVIFDVPGQEIFNGKDLSPVPPDNFTYKSTDGTLQSNTATVGVLLAPLADPPTDIALSGTTIAENQPANTIIGTLSATDPDAGETHTYSITSVDGVPSTLFNISGTSLRSGVAFNFEAKSSYLVLIRVTDKDALFFEEAFTITITNVNEAPTDISLTANTIPENSPVNTVIGTLSASDPDASDTRIFSIVSVDGGANSTFNISGTQLRSSVEFNFEAKSSYLVMIRVTDGLGLFYEEEFTINVTDANEPPVASSVAITPTDQRVGINNTGTFTFTDPDGDGQGPNQYRWYRANDASGSGAVTISGATTTTYRTVKADGGKYICFEVTPYDQHNMAGTAVRSSYKYINTPPVATNAQITAPVLQPGQNITGSFSYTDAEGDPQGSSVYQWYTKTTADYTPASPGTSVGTGSTYRLKAADAGRYIWFNVEPVAQSGSTPGDSIWSNIIGPIGAFSANIAGSESYCYGTVMPITLTVSGGSQPYTAILHRSGTMAKDTTISNITTSTYTINVRIPGSYVLTSLRDKDNEPATVTSTPVVLQFFARVTGVLTGSSELCDDGTSTANLTLNFGAGSAPWSFVVSRFRPNGTLINDTTYTNVNSDPYVFQGRIFAGYSGTLYRIRSLTDVNSCPGDTSGTGTVTLTYLPSPTAEISGIDTICPGDTAYLQVALTGTAPWSITYLRNGTNPFVINEIYNFNYTLEVRQSGTYTISRVEDALCTGKTAGSGIVRAYTSPTAVISGSTTICEHTSANLTVVLTGSSPWLFSYRRNSEDPVDIPNILSSPRAVQVTDAGTYTLYEVYDKNCKGTVSGSAVINVTPAPDVSISGLAAAYNKQSTEWVLMTGTPAGGTFTGPGVIPYNTNWYFVPSLPPVGTHNIVYSYRASPSSCFGYDTAVVRVLEADASIEFENDRTKYCQNDYPFTVTGVNVANSIGSFTISGGIGLVDHHNNTATVYPALLAVNEYTITYTYFDGTTLTKTSKFDIGKPPVADFKWESECYHAGQSITMTNTSVPNFGNLTDTSYYWKINTSTGFESYTTRDITHAFPRSGNHTIELQIETSYGCADTVTKVFGLRPTYELANNTFFEDFEDSPVDWRSGTALTPTVNSWRLGDPSKGFNGAYSGDKCWYTYIASSPAPREQSWIVSPCFDFTGTDKPMLKLRIWRLFNSNRDGANIQASADSGKTWTLIGEIGDGVLWFNSYNILGNPGNSSVGWSNNNLISNDADWVEARHSLDMLIGKKDVQFRIAYGSDYNAQGNNGIAFDDFWIVKRNRMAMLEHFTNSSSTDCVAPDIQFNGMVNENPMNFIDLQYHTSFPGSDPFNQHNPSIPSARVFYYGLSDIPYTILNGGYKSDYRFDYDTKPLDQNKAIVESLRDSKFWINLNSHLAGNTLYTEAEINALQDIAASDLTVHVAVIEQVITGVTGGNGETVFESVVKTMLPDAAGTTIYHDWTQGESRYLDNSWYLQHVFNADQLRIVAFIQDEATGEIYQAAMDTIGTFTGIGDFHGSHPDNEFIVYPNPAQNKAFILFNRETSDEVTLEVYNNIGNILSVKHIPSGTDEVEIMLENYPDGLYILRLVSRDQLIGIGKLTVTK